MEELWKDIEGFEGLYQVSNTGKIRSFIRKSETSPPWHLIKPHFARGYTFAALYAKDSKRAKNFLVHRLVAKAFVPNPNNYPEVNHKDENKQNNNADNLEWCTRAYNMSYGTARFRQGISASTPVEQLTIDGVPIALYYSIPVAAKINNIDCSSIIKCCKSKRIHTGGYRWRYASLPSELSVSAVDSSTNQ